MMQKIRHILWRILGIDHQQILNKLDYTLLKNDKYVNKGKGSYDNGAKVWRWTDAPLKIGKYCSIAHGVQFIVDEGYHTLSEITNYTFINKLTVEEDLLLVKSNHHQKEGITVENDVWIGLNSIILPGVKIGNGVTIAAGSVINRDIPAYSVVGGVPAKTIKMKHADEIIQKLNKVAWWDWSDKQIQERKKDFYLTIEDFLKRYES